MIIKNGKVFTEDGKFIENGYLHILFNGVKYNADGKIVK